MRLNTRKEELLKAVVREHARTAEPVASEHLKGELRISPATVRNEMASLEKAGYLRQPHTSAGRVPTEEGYRYYIAHCIEEQDVKEEVDAIQQNVGPGLVGGRLSSGSSRDGGAQGPALQDIEQQMKRLARELAQRLSEGVFVGFTPRSTYYTGLSYLFDQPEFESMDLVRHVGEIIDNLDKIVAELFDEVVPGVKVYVGRENPFGVQCGTVVLRIGVADVSPRRRELTLATPELGATMLGVLGPMRMDYDRMVAMMRELEKVLWTN